MKKLIIMAALVGTAVASYGQGQVQFNNTATTLLSAGGSAIANTTAGVYSFGLYIAPTTVTSFSGVNDANWSYAGVTVQNAVTAAGRITAGVVTVSGLTGTFANLGGYGNVENFALVGWSSSLGAATDVSTWAKGLDTVGKTSATAAGYYGYSGVATLQLGGGGLGTVKLFGASPSGITGINLDSYTVVATPEPASFALAGLGAAALVIFRRRK